MNEKLPIIPAILGLLAACGALGRAEPSEQNERTGVGMQPAAQPSGPATPGGGGGAGASGGGSGRAGAAAASAPHDGLRIATWNLEWLHRKSGTGPTKRSDEDYARLRRYATELAADVVAFQEVDGVEAAARVFDSAEYELYAAAQSDPQRTGFAYRRGLAVTIHPDYTPLDVGQIRVGADLTVQFEGRALRLLSVHLKSGCFQDSLSSEKKDCKKLALQVAPLEAWIDARAREGVAAIVLGDFNRRLFASKPDALWSAIDDAEPPLSDLWSPTEGRTSQCWGGAHPLFIDHIVLNQPATQLVVQGSFEERLYDASDLSRKQVLSDHCPLALTLRARAPLPALAQSQKRVTPKLADGGLVDAKRVDAKRVDARLVDAGVIPIHAMRERRIKGNVSASGRRLFHAPDCPDYARTLIDEAKGERWFETVAEAVAAGWSKPSNCP